MIRKVTILLFLIFFSLTAQSQYRKFNNPIWTLGTANTIKQNDIHLNLFYISQYGITDKVEFVITSYSIHYTKLYENGL